MPRILKRIKEEFIHVIPAVIYFFVAFNLFNLTFGAMFEEVGIPRFSFLAIVISSLVVGKVMIVADSLPFINAFPNKPLIYNTLWKTSVYSFLCYLLRLVEHLMPLLSKYGDIGLAWRLMLDKTDWPDFWTVQVWAFILFLIFVVSQELVKNIGKDNLRRMFFGR
jgi:hypothetical protein